MIKEDYVSFEIAKLLKEKGFNEICRAAYTDNGKAITNHNYYSQSEDGCIAPTHQMVMKWLREEKNVLIQVVTGIWREIKTPKKHTFLFQIYKDMEFVSFGKTDVYNTYEEAVEAALKYTLEELV